ncbi:Hsp20/alpha crystallin family protein [Bacillus sp. MRMR6]|uniref:Hsp20/alpha crystallin family protein n=1 Tax=Bacillus sp. MRMR6 TaxID=1928617 RepID=UPI0009517949|nr:Hsp20/alpha crystallin family protein [Bacillus sp. MRMR6]OLS34348.1 spore coat protein [Bacillus sp. MRMR6]
MFPWNLFPFNKQMKDNLQNMKSEEIEQFIQGIMGKVMPSHLEGMMNPQDLRNTSQSPPSQQPNMIDAVAFETHDCIFVRIPITREEWLKQLRVYHTANQLIIEHIPKEEDKHTITLPAIVKKKGASAKCKDGVLEVRLIKSFDTQFSQIEVSD